MPPIPFVHVNPDLKKRHQRIADHLDNALSNHELDVYFQPKVNLKSNTVDGAEALLRWNRGNKAGIKPDEFMPIVENSELIHRIGAWVINEACRACKTWEQASDHLLNVAVNVSALQLTRSNFYQIVVDALEQYKLPPERLEIEITEHFLVPEDTVVTQQLATLKRLGVILVVDDFGTGYSNIAYLTQLPVDMLKLDRRFITCIDQREAHHIIVSAVIAMAKKLGLKVVAEGVETAAELEVLKALNCDYGQGFLWSQAVPSEKFMTIFCRKKPTF